MSYPHKIRTKDYDLHLSEKGYRKWLKMSKTDQKFVKEMLGKELGPKKTRHYKTQRRRRQ